MRKSSLLGLFFVCGCTPPGGIARTGGATIAPIQSELTRDEQVEHVLNRLAYGARPGDVARVRDMGVERWIALQLAPERIADRASDSLLAGYRTLGATTGDLVAQSRNLQMARRDTTRAARVQSMVAEQRMLQLSLSEVTAAKLSRAVVSERQLYEQMVDFWENHFSVFVGKGRTRLFIPAYDRDVIRPHAMGRFRDLLGAVATSPAMLFYLDNWQSAADSSRSTLGPRPLRRGVPANAARRPLGLNENYARELMELHTLGVDGGYTQQDVVEVARALTGWSIDQASGQFVFRPMMHDADEKTVLGRRLPAGRGIEDGEDVLDMLAKHPSTARHITRKLAIRFVSDSPPSTLVERCAAAFSRTDGDIRATLGCVVSSPEFFSRAAYRSKVKTPFELVTSALRAADGTPDSSPRASRLVARLGQPIFGRQTPDGWPDRGEYWMNAGAMLNRVNFGMAVAAGRVPGVRLRIVDPAVGQSLATPEFQRR